MLDVVEIDDVDELDVVVEETVVGVDVVLSALVELELDALLRVSLDVDDVEVCVFELELGRVSA